MRSSAITGGPTFPPAKPPLNRRTLERVQASLDVALAQGDLAWRKSPGVSLMFRQVEVPLRQGAQGTFTAFVPAHRVSSIGTLAPDVTHVLVRRSGARAVDFADVRLQPPAPQPRTGSCLEQNSP
jgi:hypothetical protein